MPVMAIITEGTAADNTQTAALIEGIQADCLLADRGYDTNFIVETAHNARM